MARRSYGSGRLFVRADSNGPETWYGSWRVGGRPRMPRFKERWIQFLTRDELDAVVRAVPGDVLGSVEGPLYLMAATTGLRQGELIALRWGVAGGGGAVSGF